MRIQFEIKENLPEIIEEILHSDKWQTSVKEELSGRTTVVIRDQAYGSEATIEIYATSIEIKTAWSKYSYRIFVTNDIVWCEYNGAYRGLLEQVLLPTITPKENLLNSDVTESSLYGNEHRKLREYAEDIATHALASGVDAKTLSGILGHTKASFTLDTYTHTTGDMQRRAAEIVETFLTDIFGEELKPWEESARAAKAPSA